MGVSGAALTSMRQFLVVSSICLMKKTTFDFFPFFLPAPFLASLYTMPHNFSRFVNEHCLAERPSSGLLFMLPDRLLCV